MSKKKESSNDLISELSEYVKQGEPDKIAKTNIWKTAIGLQEVDGLKPSKYLVKNTKEYIDGKIDMNSIKDRINKYYEAADKRKNIEEGNEEADKVAIRIAELLSEKTFIFSPNELLNIHNRLFTNIIKEAGRFRNYNITKDEWVLNGDTVIYSSYETIKDALDYDFNLEKNFNYTNLGLHESIKHLCRFIADIWQVHPFCEGNTRTIAVFLIKYLITFGFNINDETFATNSWYFRNSLVRANYKNFELNVFENLTFLEKFFYNLITNERFKLNNRDVHIDIDIDNDIENINNKDNVNNIKTVLSKFDTLTIEEQAIINSIKDNHSITQEDIAKVIKKSSRTVKAYMLKLQEKNLIQRVNGKKNGKWIINMDNLLSEKD